MRPFALGLAAVGLAACGQKLIVEQPSAGVVPAIRWYAAGILVMLLAWVGTYKNKILLPHSHPNIQATLPVRTARRKAATTIAARVQLVLNRITQTRFFTAGRYILAFLALGLSIYCANQLRSDFLSLTYSLLWVASLLLLLLAFVGHRVRTIPLWNADKGEADIEDRTDWKPARRVELLVFLGIFMLAVAMRAYRIDDWSMGLDGDEGEFGNRALPLLEGQPASPFTVGHQGHPYFTYWAIALTIKVFGANVVGIRMFPLICFMLMMPPFYLLVRMWFGVRMAIIATVLLSIMDVSIHFSRLALDNMVTPLCLVAGFYFLFRGFRTGRVTNFVLAGYAFTLGPHFYAASRITPLLLLAISGYLFMLLPIVRLPGSYKQARASLQAGARASRLRALLAAVSGMRVVFRHATAPLVALVVACAAFIAPLAGYYIDNPAALRERSGAFIFNDPLYGDHIGQSHDPLYIGLRIPRADDIYPFSPVVFEQTPMSIKLADDGIWPRVIWTQLNHTLSILTYRTSQHGFYPTRTPIARPLEAVLIILAIAWALWRWRDARMGLLSIWFWIIVFVGGVVTSQPPYMARLVGIIPVLAIFAAIPLNKLAAELSGLAASRPPDEHPARLRAVILRRGLNVASAAMLLLVLAYLTRENYQNYYVHYPSRFLNPKSSGQAVFVRQMNERAIKEGNRVPYYYSADLNDWPVPWDYPTTRFLNRGTPGRDMHNPSNDLPVIHDEGRDVVFVLWGTTIRYLPTIKLYYPEGEQGEFRADPYVSFEDSLTYYLVTKEEIKASRMTTAVYSSAQGGKIVERQEESLGGPLKPLSTPLNYPVAASWTAGLIAPTFGNYRFQMSSASGGNLVIDGKVVLAGPPGTSDLVELNLARGVHDVQITGTLSHNSDEIQLLWDAGSGGVLQPVSPTYLYSRAGPELSGEVHSVEGVSIELTADPASWGELPVLYRSTEGCLGYGSLVDVLGESGVQSVPFAGRWVGQLQITEAGNYTFDLASSGQSVLLIDDQIVVNHPSGNSTGNVLNEATGSMVSLSPGMHQFEVRYLWYGGNSTLEAYFKPPGGQRTLIGPFFDNP